MDESNTSNAYRPNYAVPPGEVLVAELEVRGMTQHELALRTGLTPKHIVSIAKARSAITSDTAIKLERALGMPAQYWLNLESNYQEVLSRLAEEEKLARDRVWLKKVPVSEMIKRGWIAKAADAKAQLVEVLRFFGIASVEQWGEMWPNLAVAYRQHVRGEISPEAVSAWLRRGELDASKISCAPFDRNAFRAALGEIRGLTCEAPEVFVPRLTGLCARAGVAVVFVPALSKTSDGSRASADSGSRCRTVLQPNCGNR